MGNKRLLIRTAALLLIALAGLGCSRAEWAGQKTDALEDDAWAVSEWISAADAPVMTYSEESDRSADGTSWFVSETENKKAVESVKWMTTGLGVYTLFLNGTLVGNEFLKPGFTHAAKTKRSFTYDITDAFAKKAGAMNVLSAQVTPGWWADKIVNGYGQKPAFRAVLEITYKDGTVERLGTDCEHWKAGVAGPVTHASIFDGEEYDARILPGYATPDKLSTPEINTQFQGEILPSEGAEVYLRKDLTLRLVRAYVWEGVSGAVESEDPGEAAFGTVVIKREYSRGDVIDLNPGETLVVDFGQNAAAVPCFRFKAAEGTELTCLPGEILNDGNGARSRSVDGPEGSVHRYNLRMPDGMRLRYIFDDTDDYVEYCPQCTFFGYRFISVTATAPVRIASVLSIPVTSITTDMETGTLSTGSPSINQLISNTLWSQRSNYLSVPTDCPQRNERQGWTADTQVFTCTGSFFADTDAFLRKWMRDMRDSQSDTGAFPGVAPTAQYGNDMMRLGWADAGIIVPWTIWKQFGDEQIVRENWESMERFMRHVDETRYDHTALLEENKNYQWADWLSCEPLESCLGLAFDSWYLPLPDAVNYWQYLGASYWAMDAAMMADMASAIGEDAEFYDRMATSAKSYLKETFLDADGRFKTDILNTMQTPALFALKNGLVEGEARERMIAGLRQNFAEHGNCLQTGFLGTSILMSTLTANGMADIAWDLLFQDKYPSWLYSVQNGATTIWERWNSYTKENGLGPLGMNSFNHYAYGCVCQWIWETAAGIASDPAAPGFKHIIMSPIPDKRLGSLDASYKSAAGLIKSSWRYHGDRWVWHFTIPSGSTATVTLPGETQSKEYPAGSHTVKMTL